MQASEKKVRKCHKLMGHKLVKKSQKKWQTSEKKSQNFEKKSDKKWQISDKKKSQACKNKWKNVAN